MPTVKSPLQDALDAMRARKERRFSRDVLLEAIASRSLHASTNDSDAVHPREREARILGATNALKELQRVACTLRVSKTWLRSYLEDRVQQLALQHPTLDRGIGYAQTSGRGDDFCRAYGDFRICLDIADHFDLGI